MKLQTLIILSLSLLLGISAEQCGSHAGGAVCPNGLCCSQFGWCGTASDYCSAGCQSQCSSTPKPTPTPTPSGGGGDVSSLISSFVFDQMLKYRNDGRCPSNGFYKYDAFIAAARSFNGFGTMIGLKAHHKVTHKSYHTTGDVATRKKELVAFLAQTSHETTGGWASAPDGPYAWGYCFVNEQNQDVYCTPSNQYPCAAGKKYYGRGPIQLTHNYNYCQAGQAIGKDLINNPDLVATDPVVSFRTAMWFWMTPQGNKPSSHDVITGRWSPSSADTSAGRVPGYGVITNIINGGLECGKGQDARVASRIGFYRRYCEILQVSPGDNLDCYNQRPFA
ncbi:endochitinase-like precursor [Pyrus ussuriensis x Pyrus communis]|uniref:chitinase n=1 Tax=Pyrus ussuriensis x Pyrus communis TaxID=2448454 RepID=A0A5N5GWD4_9ROSA|nr:endochitinase-like precursor [Pyrus ussuriensis x Pyrus communis]